MAVNLGHWNRSPRSTRLLFVYRLGVASQTPRWRLRELRPNACYTVERGLATHAHSTVLSGADLMSTGLAVDLPAAGGSRTCAAVVYVVKPQLILSYAT